MTVKALPSVLYYSAWDTALQQFKAGDEANHSLTISLGGAAPVTPTNAPASAGDGVYGLVLTDAERVAETAALSGSSSTEGVVIQPVAYSADARLEGMTEPSVGDATKATYLSEAHKALETHGDANWATADVSLLALEESAQLILTTGDVGPWTTGGGGETGDWTNEERQQIRYRIGLDGATAMPAADPDLAQKTDLVGLDVNIVSWGGDTDVIDTFLTTQSSIRLTTVDSLNTAPTADVFDTPLTESDTDHWKNRSVIMLTGVLAFQASVITGYQLVGGKGQLTTAGFTRAPSGGDQLIIV